jgi:AcrR family transcriptional regulator
MEDARVTREKAIRETKTNLILDAALKVFSEKGFHDTRLEDIAAQAGFSKASLYNYYTDKEAIFLSLAIREYERITAVLNTLVIADEPFDKKFSAVIESIFKIFGEHFAFILTMSNYRTLNLITMERLSDNHEKMAATFRKLHDEITHIFTALCASARKKGDIASTLPDTVLARYLGALIRSILMEWKINGAIGDIPKEVEQIVTFVKHGCGTAGRTKKNLQ